MFTKLIFVISILFIVTNILNADKLADIKKAGVMVAGIKYDFKPFGFINKSGSIVGFDVDCQ